MNLRIRRIARTALIVAMLMIHLCASALAASYACKINADTKVYQRASSASASIKVSRNTKCTMTGLSGSWAKVERSGITAYIPVKYLTLTNRITGYAAKDTAMYKKASSSSGKLGTLEKGTKVYINGRDGSYFRVQNKDGSITGYVKMANLTPNKPKADASANTSKPAYSSEMSASEKLNFVISTAESLKGAPYASSAKPPQSFDCSRFVKHCFGQAKVSLSGSAKSQGYSTKFDRITSASKLKRGDIVVFNTNESDSDLSDHTGIYMGNGSFIHASSAAGKVIVSSLSSGYYERTFSWGLRIFE